MVMSFVLTLATIIGLLVITASVTLAVAVSIALLWQIFRHSQTGDSS